MPRERGDVNMTWRAALRLPPEAGEKMEEYARRWGVAPAVAARIVLMQWLEEQERQGKPERAKGSRGDEANDRTS